MEEDPTLHVDASPTAVIPPTTAAGDVDPKALISKTSTTNEVADVLHSTNLHTTTPIRVSPGAATRTSGGVTTRSSRHRTTLLMGGRNEVDSGSTVWRLLVFVLVGLPFLTLPRLRRTRGVQRSWRRDLSASIARFWGRTRLLVRCVSPWRQYPVGYWVLFFLIGGGGGPHLFFVEATPKGTLTDAEFETATWGTLVQTQLTRTCVYLY